MKLEQVIKKVETLTHSERWEYMIEVGKQAKEDKKFENLIGDLVASTSQYERALALMSTQGSFDSSVIIKIAKDVSLNDFFPLVKLAVKNVSSNELKILLPQLPKYKRKQFAQRLFLKGRHDVLEGVFEELDPYERRELIVYTSETFFLTYIEMHGLESIHSSVWKTIVRNFPLFAVESLIELIDEGINSNQTLKQSNIDALMVLAKIDVKLGLRLLKHTSLYTGIPVSIFKTYASFFPEEIAQIMLKMTRNLRVFLSTRSLRKISSDTLCKLVEREMVSNISNNNVFSKLRKEQRVALYQIVSKVHRNMEDGTLNLAFVKHFPKSIREIEARYALNTKVLESKPERRAPYFCMLSFEESSKLALKFLNQPDGGLRAIVVHALVTCGRYYPSELDEILDFCIKQKNERDPVRSEMIRALADIPLTHWQKEHEIKLKQIIDHAYQARDCSHNTMNQIGTLLFRMLSNHSTFVIGELPRLLERMGWMYQYSLLPYISDENLIRLDEELVELLQLWINRDQYIAATIFIKNFGYRVKSAHTKQKLVGKELYMVHLLKGLTKDRRGIVARCGLETLMQLGIQDEVSELIPLLIKEDDSWIRIHGVSNYIGHYRQDLLTNFLKPRKYKNRFSSNALDLITFNSNFVRWSEKQQQIYANSLFDIIYSTKRSMWELSSAIRRISKMPFIDVNLLFDCIELHEDIVVKEKIIEAIGRCDPTKAVPYLMNALNGKQARVAIYALRQPALMLSEEKALSYLSKVPKKKIVIMKEMLRLIGTFKSEHAYQVLQTFEKEGEELHPDVQIALMQAYWSYLDKAEAWELFHKAAKGKNVAVACATISIPFAELNKYGKEQMMIQMELLLQHSDAQVRVRTLSKLVAQPLGIKNKEMFGILVQMLGDSEAIDSNLVAIALLITYLPSKQNELVEVFSNIEKAELVQKVTKAFSECYRRNIQGIHSCASLYVKKLILDGLYPIQALDIMLNILDPSEILIFLNEMKQLELLHPSAVERSVTSWQKIIDKNDKDEVFHLESTLRNSKYVEFRRLGFGLLICLSKHYGWSECFVEKLNTYKQDSSIWVSEEARLIELTTVFLSTEQY